MVLVDTSVWIRFLSNKAPFAGGLDKLLSWGDVAGHEMVFGELLLGNPGKRDPLLNAYAQMPLAKTVPHNEVVEFVRIRQLQGRGVGWIDVHLLASALVSHVRLWTADQHLQVVATDLGVGYQV